MYMKILLVKLVFALFVASFSFILYLLLLDGAIMPYLVDVPRVQTPALRGLSAHEAALSLERAGLYLAVRDSLHHEILVMGKIVNQDPPPGQWIRKGRRIAVEVSLGPSYYPVPQTIAGVSLREAQLQLEASQLRLGELAYVSSESIPEGVVIRATPAAGTLLPRNTLVDLEISHGSPRLPKPVPQLQGLLVEQAQDTLRKYEMRLGKIVDQVDPSRPTGTVLEQTPQAQQRVSRLTAVDLVISVKVPSPAGVETILPLPVRPAP